MEIRRYVAIGWKRWLIYGGFLAAAWVTGIVGLVHPSAKTHTRLGAAVLMAASTYIVARLFAARLAVENAIGWYTRQGMAVLPGEARAWLLEHKEMMEEHIDRTVRWWGERHIGGEARLRDFLNGGQITVVVGNGPLRDAKFGTTGRALTSGSHTTVLWQPKDSGADFLALLRHEIGHMCLTAMGIDQDVHHERMKTDGFPDA